MKGLPKRKSIQKIPWKGKWRKQGRDRALKEMVVTQVIEVQIINLLNRISRLRFLKGLFFRAPNKSALLRTLTCKHFINAEDDQLRIKLIKLPVQLNFRKEIRKHDSFLI